MGGRERAIWRDARSALILRLGPITGGGSSVGVVSVSVTGMNPCLALSKF